ncbi:hypothetical protein PIB30_025289 [Stylosanthes scabra]|uniref:Aminotransferase-like plant mobile domain-containing protein n=1 Tax=Stylosanthes scabra TaxID=79078 RepID=A0ABU6V862_9FABA|nr:hypothetical protein [Stylosanthes scabra]
MFGELPEESDRDSCTVTFSWLKSKFEELSDDASDELVVRHARAYIWMLLSTSLFGDKTAARAHVRWLPFLEHIDELGQYSWGPQSLPDCRRVCVEQSTGISSRWQGHWICCRARFSGGFRSLGLTVSTLSSGHWLPDGGGISPYPTRKCPVGGSKEAA